MCNVMEMVELRRQINSLQTQLSEKDKKLAEMDVQLSLAAAELKPAATIDMATYSSVILDKLDEVGDGKADLLLADLSSKIFNKAEVVAFLGLDETDKIQFIDEEHDCDDFARKLFGKGLPLLWSWVHAFNWFIDLDLNLWFIEPQSDKIAPLIEDWQGLDVRFFLSV